MKDVKIEWCENFIKSVFKKHVLKGGSIETGCFCNKNTPCCGCESAEVCTAKKAC